MIMTGKSLMSGSNADCRLKYQTYRVFKIRNPQSAFRNLNYSRVETFKNIWHT
jgi:hypothetical protein